MDIKEVKYWSDYHRRQLAGTFHKFADDCDFKKEVYHGKDPWFKCTHKSYHLAKYGVDITPCDVDRCPLLN